MLGRTLIVHADGGGVGDLRAALAPQVEVDVARTLDETVRRLAETDYGVVLLDLRHPDLFSGRFFLQLVLAAPDAVFILVGTGSENVSALEELAPGRIFRYFAGRGDLSQIRGTVREALRLHRMEREQAELIRRLQGEYAKIQRREKLLDVVVRERTRELEHAYERLQASARQAILGLADAIEAKDAYTKGHCGRVAVYAMELARAARLSDEELRAIEFGAFLHDIGKIGVRDAVLLKPGPLDETEWNHMRIHPLVGSQIASQIEMLQPLVPCVRNHHERWDGSGYPDNLRGEAIPLAARIVCLADAYDAMATDRPYKRALPPAECDKAMRRQAGVQFDPALVELFIARRIADLAGGS